MIDPLSYSFVTALVVGLLAGCHASIWGMYKDALHEGFKVSTFIRSIVIGGLVAVVIQASLRFQMHEPQSMLLLFGLAYAVERAIVEVWKTFLRQEDQSKYFIPMQFSIGGVPVASAALRIVAGIGYLAAIGFCLAMVDNLDSGSVTMSHTARAALAGLVIGLLLAAGGSWKDAPKEGFDTLKFFRSPLLCVVYAALLGQITMSYTLIAIAAVGYERATAETYKTFFFPRKPRGKFSGKPVLYPKMLRVRLYFVPAYVAICAGVIACAAAAL